MNYGKRYFQRMGAKGGRQGGRSRALSMSPARRREIASGAGMVAARTHRAERLARLAKVLKRTRRVGNESRAKEPTP